MGECGVCGGVVKTHTSRPTPPHYWDTPMYLFENECFFMKITYYMILFENDIYQAYGRMPPTPKKVTCPKKGPKMFFGILGLWHLGTAKSANKFVI